MIILKYLPARKSLMGIDSPFTGAPSMISYFATVSVSVVVLGPKRKDKKCPEWKWWIKMNRTKYTLFYWDHLQKKQTAAMKSSKGEPREFAQTLIYLVCMH